MQQLPFGVMFHHFWDGTRPRGQGAMSADQFDRLIEWIGRNRIIGASEWYERATSDRLDENQICLTFDDGLKCQFDVARPVLDHHGLTAFWFVYTAPLVGRPERLETYRAFRTEYFDDVADFYTSFFETAQAAGEQETIETASRTFDSTRYLSDFPFYSNSDRWFRFVRDEVFGPDRYHEVMDRLLEAHGTSVEELGARLWMSGDELRSLSRAGHVIGLHSHTHPTRLERMSRDEQADEYRINHAALTEILQRPPTSMSHPCNSYDAVTLSLLESLGIKLGFRSNMAMPEPASTLEWPREDHANLTSRMTG